MIIYATICSNDVLYTTETHWQQSDMQTKLLWSREMVFSRSYNVSPSPNSWPPGGSSRFNSLTDVGIQKSFSE